MNNRMILAPACFIVFLFSQLVPIDWSTDLLSCGLYAEEISPNETWKEEFAAISSKAAVSMSLSTEELQSIVERCDKLQPTIESLEETPRKIYLKRLEKMKSLFIFVIDSHHERQKK